MLFKIQEHLFLSDKRTAVDESTRQTIDVFINAAGTEFIKREDYLELPLLDSLGQNILEFFNICDDIIKTKIEESKQVLVYCEAGISRSATIILSYLMLNMNFNDAYSFLKEIKSDVEPNDSFKYQLILFHERKEEIDSFLKKLNVYCYQSSDLAFRSYLNDKLKSRNYKRNLSHLRCRMCRTKLVESSEIISDATHDKCSIYITECLDWVQGVKEGTLEGKINCSKCGYKVGNYSWRGMPCSCGEWLVPFFAIHKQRVDPIDI
jgi:dual specificity phosphatase 12